jgi:hypothetical protein
MQIPARLSRRFQDLGRAPPTSPLNRGIQQKAAAQADETPAPSLIGRRAALLAPEVRFWPAILTSWATCDPRPEAETFGGRLRAARIAGGLSEEVLTRQLGLDPGTVAAWEGD